MRRARVCTCADLPGAIQAWQAGIGAQIDSLRRVQRDFGAPPVLEVLPDSGVAGVCPCLAGLAKAVDLEGVEERLESLQRRAGAIQPRASKRAGGQGPAAAAGDAGEVVLMAVEGGIDALAVGQAPGAHQTEALELVQGPIDAGEAEGVAGRQQAPVQLLAAEFSLAAAQQIEQTPLPRAGLLNGVGPGGAAGGHRERRRTTPTLSSRAGAATTAAGGRGLGSRERLSSA